MVDARHTAFVAFVIVSAIYTIALLFYFPVAYLNLSWTHSGLPLVNVLHYNPAGSNAQVERYGGQWWWIATDILRVLVPPIAMGFVWYYSVYTTGKDESLEEAGVSTGLYIFTFVIIMFIDLAKAGYYSYFWAFDCDGLQICRNHDPAGNANDANGSYIYLTSFTIAFFVLAIVFLMLEIAAKLVTRASAKANQIGVAAAHLNSKAPFSVIYSTPAYDARHGVPLLTASRGGGGSGSRRGRSKRPETRPFYEVDVGSMFETK